MCLVSSSGSRSSYSLLHTRSTTLFRTMRLMLETEGTPSWGHTPSVTSRSLISQANMVGFSRLYFAMASTTCGVATLGLLPPITPARKVPVS